ncbi:MAG: SOS response-associated peptidase [Burkholderiaceae bacterium]|nr:SOS response-associated peptidase [Burkholderiaceae bacterium]
MCGRYVIAYDPQTLVSGFSLTRIQPFDRRWNVAPQSAVPVVYETRDGERVAELMRWGLVPHWAKDPAIGAKLNNARSEGMADKPSFRQAVRRRRCILPTSGFYEWQPVAGSAGKPVKQPYYISPTGAPFFAMAGLFEAWRPPVGPGEAEPGEWVLTCCVITTAANALMAPIHDRMPVMLAPEHWAAWLARGNTDAASLPPLMQGLPEAAMQAWPVARTVGRSSAEGPQLIEPLAAAGSV